jgi:hypothetical protein
LDVPDPRISILGDIIEFACQFCARVIGALVRGPYYLICFPDATMMLLAVTVSLPKVVRGETFLIEQRSDLLLR